jgi:hypothetical protein
MPKLNDYIGSLVSSITEARVMSDMQTVKVAEEYAKHDLLKHFSIPRMRIDDIEMTIPVALDAVSEKTETAYQPIDNTSFNSLVYRESLGYLGVTKLNADISQNVKAQIAKNTNELEESLKITKDLVFLKDYVKKTVSMILTLEKKLSQSTDGVKPKINADVMNQNLEKILSQEIKVTKQNQGIESLNVIIEASKLREQKPENIIYIKLKISEDGMEWNRTENSEGKTESKLLPE